MGTTKAASLLAKIATKRADEQEWRYTAFWGRRSGSLAGIVEKLTDLGESVKNLFGRSSDWQVTGAGLLLRPRVEPSYSQLWS